MESVGGMMTFGSGISILASSSSSTFLSYSLNSSVLFVGLNPTKAVKRGYPVYEGSAVKWSQTLLNPVALKV